MQNPAASPPNTAAAIELAFASATTRGTASGSTGRTPGRADPGIRDRRFLANRNSPKASSASAGTAVQGKGGRLEKLISATSHAIAVQTIATSTSDHDLVGCMRHSWA